MDERITAFISGARDDTFESLAEEAFAFQYGRILPFRRLCDARGVVPGESFDWRRVPAVPVAAFRSQALHAAPPVEIFRSSGTTGGSEARSVHYHPFPDLYRAVIDATFPGACLPAGTTRRPVLSLVPDRRTVPDSSLGFMCEHVVNRFGEEPRAVAMGADGLDLERVLAWREALGERPATILATAFALAFLAEALQGRGLRLHLPVGSTLFETGGFKGRTRELERRELLDRIRERLGIPGRAVVREYGMTELTGHFYTAVLHGGDGDRFVVPPFLRVRMLDPQSLEEVPAGEPGLLTVFDLANVGSAIQVVTQDLGIRDDDDHGSGFRLVGRAAEAQLRGCSLTAEELGAPS